MAEDNWDLQAVVRGYVGEIKTSTAQTSSMSRNPPSYMMASLSSPALILSHQDRVVPGDEATLFGLQDLLENQVTLQDLHDDLCEPLSPKTYQLKPSKNFPFPPLLCRPRKRKSQQVKKVVCHVPAGDHSDDTWAWRKYGQKPIKGSPFPRGYYRCSSTKTCVARKQVERSWSDPDMYVNTYTGEHNHSPPTHRNILSGSTRKKFLSKSAAVKSATAKGRSGSISDNTA